MEAEIRFLGKHIAKINEFRRHSHEFCEIIYFLSGRGKVYIENESFSVSERQYWIVPAGTEHTECLDEGGEILFIGFSCSQDVFHNKVFRSVSDDGEIRTVLFRIFDEYRKRETAYASAMKAYLELLLISVFRKSAAGSEKRLNLEYMKEYIEQYYDRKINFGELTNLTGYSYDYFRKIFRERYGVSPKTYLMDVRLSHARRMLSDTDLTCTEIAYLCGFSNSQQMSSLFEEKLIEAAREIVRFADSL